jgi:hypothetical protein
MITEQDKQLLDRMITLENLMITLEKEQLLVKTCSFKIPEVYHHFFDHMMELVRKDMVALRAIMRKEQLKIISIQEDDGFTQYNYLCKGYQSHFRYWSYGMDMKVTNAFYEYLPFKSRK